jgi:hypothetical protein
VSDTRVTINGYRHYNVLGVNRPLASVTSILSATQSEDSRRKLAAWNAMNPGALEKAAERGTWIHNGVENYVRGIKVDPPKHLQPYWDGMPEKLDELFEGGRILWSEKPMNMPSWNKYVGADGVGRIHYYDEKTDHGWAGCCDVIYEDQNGEIILGDFKTSLGPYSARFPSSKADIDDKLRKALIGGVYKTKKTRLQLAAYKLAAERCFGIKIAKTQIIVSTPLPEFSVQVFTFSGKDVEKDEAAWHEVVRKFYSDVAVP